MKIKELIDRLTSLHLATGDIDVMLTVTAEDGLDAIANVKEITLEQSHGEDEAMFVRIYGDGFEEAWQR